MESDFRKEMDARLDATQAQVTQKLMEHKSETSAIIDAFGQQMQTNHAENAAEFAKIRAENAADFAKIRAENAADFAKIHAELATMKGEMRAQFATLHAEHKEGIAEVVKWVVGIFAGAMVSFVTVVTFVLNHAS